MLNLFQHFLIPEEVDPRSKPFPDPVAPLGPDSAAGDVVEAEPLGLMPGEVGEGDEGVGENRKA